ncbi:hypothetical protein [Isoptericola cucumis]|uniref:Uncharacterized protein n=1 Tax=Isoptericola cucumis TaxID=1776856 RepID=A0ABQ2B7U7_9MICO|nr:hypothetical protein [Isoptericola cucumis]GGI08105.1 hypothetical protein GCM10007368_19490 [Isoptericola cucumis]
MSTGGPSPTRRAVLEGLGVAVVGGVAGFAWFNAVGPPPEDERDRLEDERDDVEDRLEDERDDVEDRREEERERLEDLQDDDGPGRGSR